MSKNNKKSNKVEENIRILKDSYEIKKPGRSGWRVFWGILFLFAAVGVVISAFGLTTFGIGVNWLILSVVLLAVAIACLVKMNWFGFFMSLAGILTILVTQTEYLPALNDQIGTIWVVGILASIGSSILSNARKPWQINSYKSSCFEDEDNPKK